MEQARFRVFNLGEELEFAECTVCGYEVDPVKEMAAGYPSGERPVSSYPVKCPLCGRKIVEIVTAEEDQ